MDGENYISVKATGHANYSAPGVEDIVCASVSVLMQTAIVSIDSFSRYESYNIASGDLGIKIADELTAEERKAANVILASIILGIEHISEVHANNVKVDYQEG